MPVDENINLDNPDGITQEQIDQLEADADKLETIAERAEVATKKLDESGFNKLNFAQMNILEGFSNTRQNDSNGGIGSMNTEQLAKLVVELMEKTEEAKKERSEAKSKQEEIEESIKNADRERAMMMQQLKGDIRQGEGKFYEFIGATDNPIAFGKGKALSMVGSAGIVGMVAVMVFKMGEFLYKQWEKSFAEGGANDVRKLVDDRTRELAELDDIVQRRNGRVFFSSDTTLHQGAPQFSNTERLRDQVLRFQALHLGE